MSPLTDATRAEEGTADPGPGLRADGAGLAGLAWVTWRQHRWALLFALVVAAALSGWMTYLASEMTGILHECHDSVCAAGSPQELRLQAPFGPVDVADNLLLAVQYLPLLIGMFLGVPVLAREFEQRTLLLAWSQDVSPMRWMWTKLLLLGLFVAVLTAGLSVASGHLAQVLHDLGEGSMFEGQMFFDSGMLPLVIGISWFVVGVALGAAVRRILPAGMAVVLGFVGLMLTVDWRYPRLVTPVSRFAAFALGDPHRDDTPMANALVIKSGIAVGPGHVVNLYDSAHHAVTWPQLQRMCPDFFELSGEDSLRCFSGHHLTHYQVYQPGDRIPEFHLLIAAGYLGLGAVALLTVWLLVRRTALSAG